MSSHSPRASLQRQKDRPQPDIIMESPENLSWALSVLGCRGPPLGALLRSSWARSVAGEEDTAVEDIAVAPEIRDDGKKGHVKSTMSRAAVAVQGLGGYAGTKLPSTSRKLSNSGRWLTVRI
uniref:Uncharacterized protein n=1 Tax=Oryza meridionalis TaxID=40149 RepID=A0A0E0EA41_9ORYZ